ncbi:hypothetical protein GXW83_27300 [Streptacidiphilus sp. PB12-B1b]|uniref:hypothetical protein n=1 Tax=Streptacidiphilus sp. PB12-B1b TaxID=2705012 RepID=UPI0015FD43EA|nr:hypothetical protein [Streptacidiphilus sp. PB12-B1b]QMU78854.1 hypothetical protein GXW83_27300 [Streptacidiphilus sp. PB12-B1b]
MTTDPGEALFERYLDARGYEILDYEPDLGTAKRPDYLVRADGHEVVVEVKSFDPPPVTPASSPSGFVPMPKLTAVRSKISTGASQLKGIAPYPLVVVLANPRMSPVPLAPAMVIAAMYGDQQVSFTQSAELTWTTGRNGRLHVDEPDNSVRGSHPYLSAVCVLRVAQAEDARIVAWLRGESTIRPNVLAAYGDGTPDAAPATADEVVSLDVFETVSKAATALPREVFAGPNDTRWGPTAPGRYGPIAPGSTRGTL